MNILSEVSSKNGPEMEIHTTIYEEVPRTQQDKWDVDSAVSYPHLDPPNSSGLYIASPSLWRKRVRLTHHRRKAAYPVTSRGGVGLQQRQEKVAVIQGHSHWLCGHLWVPVQGCWAFGHLPSPKSANSSEWIPQSFEALHFFFPTGIALLLHFW